eukprot:TRINITY_DN19454_c0_g1_i5.p1 TRINITY_DN19454_c0_g1~~TRINITY_DN19454_c0_g1_i5.p1  ORF type:complete len:544 (+),score=185.85 TRINITY_DN19454_c0_g1_i5:553-2184(+)
MKEAIRAMEAALSNSHEKVEKCHKVQRDLIEKKKDTAMQLVGLLGEMALCENPAEASKIEKQCAKLEKELAKISTKFFNEDKAMCEIENDALGQRKELLRSLQSMQTQQSSQAKRRQQVMSEQLGESQARQKHLQKQLDGLETELEPVTREYMEAQALLESENSSTIAECRRQQTFLNELESSYAGLLEEIDSLNKQLAQKQQELNDCDDCMQQVKSEINKTEQTLQAHPAREAMRAAEVTGKAMRELADGVKAQLDEANKEQAKMHEAQDEFQGWLDHVQTVMDQTDKQITMEKQQMKSGLEARAQAQSALQAQHHGKEDDSQHKQELEQSLQELRTNTEHLKTKDKQQQENMDLLETQVASRSNELSQLHQAKAAAVTAKQFKQATQLSQQIRQATESEQADGEALAALMQEAEDCKAQLLEAEQQVQQKTFELMALEQEASETTNDDTPAGCNALRQAAELAAESQCGIVAQFLQLERATLLAGSQAAQGFPPQEWQTQFRLAGVAHSDDLASFAPTAAPAEDPSDDSDDSDSSSSSESD